MPRRDMTGYWHCTFCGGRNYREDGPICQDCGVDAETGLDEYARELDDLMRCYGVGAYMSTSMAAVQREPWTAPVSAADFLPAGVSLVGPDDDDLPF